MKTGASVRVPFEQMLEPLVGTIVDITLVGGEQIRARITSIDTGVNLKVVSKDTKA